MQSTDSLQVKLANALKKKKNDSVNLQSTGTDAMESRLANAFKQERAEKLYEKQLEQQAKLDYYNSLKQNSDWEEKSKQNVQILTPTDVTPLKMVFGKTKESIQKQLNVGAMDDDQRAIYNYLYHTDKKQAEAYYKELQEDLSQKSLEAVQKTAREFADKNTGTAIAGSAISVATNFLSPLDGIGNLGEGVMNSIKGKGFTFDTTDDYLVHTTNALREGASADMGAVGKFLYGTGMSMLDNIARAPFGAVGAGIMAMGQAASQGMVQGKEMGMSDWKAALYGIGVGAIEGLTEAVSVDKLLDKTSLAKSVKGYILKNVIAEGFEEGTSELADKAYQMLLAGDEAEWRKEYQAYISQGHSKAEAIGLVVANTIGDVGLASLSGAISGGAMAGGSIGLNTAINTPKNIALGREVSRGANATGELLNAAEALKSKKIDNTARKMANAKEGGLRQDYLRGKLTNQVMAEAYEKLHPYGDETETKRNDKPTHDAKVAQKKLTKENKKRTANGQQTIAEEFEQSDFGQKYNTFKEKIKTYEDNQLAKNVAATQGKINAEQKDAYNVSEDGKTYLIEKNEQGKATLKEAEVAEFAGVKEGVAQVKLSDGSVVPATDMSLPVDVAKQYRYAASYNDTAVAKAFIDGYSSYNGTIEAYAEEVKTAYALGKEAGDRGISEMINTLPKTKQKDIINNPATAAAFDAGKARAKKQAEDAVKMKKARDAKKSRSEVGSESETEIKSSVREEIDKELQEWFDTTSAEERAKSGKRFLIGRTTTVLKGIGVKDYDIYFGGSKINKILTDNTSMSLDVIKKAIKLLEDPILIMKSNTVEDSIVIFGEVYTDGNKPVMISVLLNPKTKSGEILDYAVITSAYGRRVSNLKNLINTSKIYYVNEQKNRTDKWLKALGLQLPSAITKYGSIGSISEKSEKVNTSDKKTSESNGKIAKKRSKGSFTISSEVDMNSLNATQKAAIKRLKILSKCLGKVNIVVVDKGVGDATGMYQGENGWYDPNTDTIYISVTAGKGSINDIGDYALVETLSHEVVHFVKEHSEADYEKLKLFLQKNVYTAEQWNNLVLGRLEQYKFTNESAEEKYKAAEEEVVANACQTMLNSPRVLAALAKDNYSLFERIKLKIANFFDSLERKLGDYVFYESEAQIVLRSTKKTQRELEKKFVEAVRQARSNSQSSTESTKNSEAENKTIKASMRNINKEQNRTFSYDELVAKNNLMGITISKEQQVPIKNDIITGDVKIDSKSIIEEVKGKCKTIKTNSATLKYYVEVSDIGANVEITRKGIEHGYMKALEKGRQTISSKDLLNARVSLELPQILSNSIEVNISDRSDNIDIPYSHIMMGTVALENDNGGIEYYAVRSVIEERVNQDPILAEAEVVGKLHATNAKKIDSPHVKVVKDNVARTYSEVYTYSIAEFLEDVKGVFDDTFSKDVYDKLGVHRADNYFSKTLRFHIRSNNAISTRDMIMDSLAMEDLNGSELRSVNAYRKRIKRIDELVEKRAAVNRELTELTNKKGSEAATRRSELRVQRDTLSRQITSEDKLLFNQEKTKHIKKVVTEVMVKRIENAVKNQNMSEVERYSKAVVGLFEKRIADLRKSEEDKRVKEAVKAYKESKKTKLTEKELREKIKKLYKKYYNMLKNPSDNNYVPTRLAQAICDILALLDFDTGYFEKTGRGERLKNKRESMHDFLNELSQELTGIVSNDVRVRGDDLPSEDYDMLSMAYEKYLLDDLRDLSTMFGDTVTIAELDVAELDMIYQVLKQMDETAREAKKLISLSEYADAQDAANSIAEEQMKIAKAKKSNKVLSAIDKAVTCNALDVMDNVLIICNHDESSPLYQVFNALNEGHKAERDLKMLVYKMFEEVTVGKENEKALKDAHKAIDTELKDSEGNIVQMTEMSIISALLSIKSEDSNPSTNHVFDKDGNGILMVADANLSQKGLNNKAIQNCKTVHITRSDVTMLEEKLSEWSVKYMEAIQKSLALIGDAVNKASLESKGYLIATMADYFPFVIDKDYLVREISDNNDITTETVNTYGPTHSRRPGASQPLIIMDADIVVKRHLDKMSKFVGLCAPVQDFNRMWNSLVTDANGNKVLLKKMLKDIHGKERINVLEQAVKDMQSARRNSNPEDIVSTAAKRLNDNFAPAVLMGNLSSMLKQPSAVYSAMTILKHRPDAAIHVARAKALAGMKNGSIYEQIDKYTSALWERRQGLSTRELGDIATQIEPSFLLRQVKKLPSWANGANWLQTMDVMNACAIWLLAEEDVKELGEYKEGSEEYYKAVATLFENVMEKTQVTYDVLHRSELMKTNNQLVRGLLAFQNETFKQFGQIYMAFRGVVTAYHSGDTVRISKAWNHLGKTLLAVFRTLLSLLLFTLGANALLHREKYFGNEDGEITVGSVLKASAWEFGSGAAGFALPVLGTTAYDLVENAITGSYGYDAFSIPSVSAANDFIRSISSIFRGDFSWSKVEKFAFTSLETLQGVPATNYKNIVQAFIEWLKSITGNS